MKLQPTDAFPWPTFDIDLDKLLSDVRVLIAGKCRYRLGAKAVSSTPPVLIDALDCSGMVRYLLVRRGVPIADGSQTQREWAIKEGLKESTPEACLATDGVLRLVVLPTKPAKNGKPGRKVGHVVLTLNGETIESHGGKGPNRRKVSSLPWFKECRVFVLTRP